MSATTSNPIRAGATRQGATRQGATRLAATRLAATRLSATRLAAIRLGAIRLPHPRLGSGGALLLGLGAIAIAIGAVSADARIRNGIFLVVNAGSAVAILVGVSVRRPARRWAWLAIAAAMALYTVADVLQLLAPMLGDPTVGLAGQGLYVAGYPLFFAAALRFAVGARRIDPVVLVDTAIVGLATLLLVWEVLVEPNMPADLATGAALLAVGYPVVATLLVTLLLPLVLMPQTRSVSAALLIGGLAFVGLADTHYGLSLLAGPIDADALTNAGWLAGYLLLGAAGIVPSAARLGAATAPRTMHRDAFRFIALSFALVIPPVMILNEAGTASGEEMRSFAVVAILLAGLAVLRLQRTVGEFVASDQRFRRFMSHDSFLALIKDGHGRYSYMNPTAERARHHPAGDWYGRIDAELYPPALATRRQHADERVRHSGETAVETVEEDGRTWLIERFLMPGNHGSIGVLGMDVTGRVRAEQRLLAAERAADRWTRERALIAETLTALDAGRTPEETADAVCARVVQLPDTAIASLITFGVDGIATVVGQAIAGGAPQAGLRLPRDRSDYLRERASAGPWVERWIRPPGHPYAPLLERLAVRAHAFAPLTRGGEVVGVLIVGSAAPDAMVRLTERIPALAEFGQITSALLGPQLADRIATARAEGEVRELIDGEAFDIAFQPIVELATGEIPGYEALARFRDGAPPDDHFRRAREVGLGPQLELACLRAALREAANLEPGAWLNVNVSPELVLTNALVELLPIEGRVVVLEITEHEAITDYAAFRAAVARLDGGVKVCVDDAGAGFASLRHIVELDPLFVKLDRSLVAGIGTDAARQAVVVGMVRFAETAGLTLVAEGIETEAELAALRKAAVPLGQGYLLGCPAIAGRRRLN